MMQFLRNLFSYEQRVSPEDPRIAIGDPRLAQVLFGESLSAAGIAVTPESALRFAAVFTCIRVLAETIGSLPLQVFERTDGGKRATPKNPIYRLVHDEPNPWMTSVVWRELAVAHAGLWGNHYSRIEQTSGGNILGLIPLMPWLVRPLRLPTGEIVYDVTLNNGAQERLPADEVLHIPALGWDGIKGISPIGLMRNAVGLGLQAEEFGARFFANDARPGFVIETPANLGKAGAEQIKEELSAKYQGTANKHKAMVLGPGIKLHTVTMPLDDAQFLDTRKFQRNEIHAIYRVPPHLAGDLERATFSNIEQQDIGFAKHTIRPWLVRFEQEMNRKLFSQRSSNFVEFNLDGLLRGDFKSRMEGYTAGINGGFITRNEVRELENFEPLPGLERPLVPQNVATVNGAGDIEPVNQPSAAPPGVRELIINGGGATTKQKTGRVKRLPDGEIEFEMTDVTKHGRAKRLPNGEIEFAMTETTNG